jgi:hypothetical protein
MNRAILIAMLLLAGCGGDEETWGGATEQQAREVLLDPNVRAQIEGLRGTYPSEQQIEDADLRQVTLQGQEAWEFEHPTRLNYCLFVYEDPATDSFTAQLSGCVAD